MSTGQKCERKASCTLWMEVVASNPAQAKCDRCFYCGDAGRFTGDKKLIWDVFCLSWLLSSLCRWLGASPVMWHAWQGDAERLLSQDLLMCVLSPSASRGSAQYMLACLFSVLTIFPYAAIYKDTNIITLFQG